MDSMKRMKELIPLLTQASRAYYQEDRELMSNYEYDKLYDELVKLEAETGITLAGSPTTMVGYEALEELPKEAHEKPMLSLDKTKDVETLRSFVGTHKTLLSWKLDGLTIVLTYQDGKLEKAVTRGNGVIGEVITNNARVFKNIPLQISHKGNLVLRGEAIITYSDFEKINSEIEDVDAKYKNPRNLCSGSVRQLNNEITAKRNVHFYAFSLVQAEGVDFQNSVEQQFLWLQKQGFDVVEYRAVTQDTLDEAMQYFEHQVSENDFPSDGLVALYDDIAYGASLGSTAKFPRNAFAFKWKDEIKETTLREIEWSPSRTGLINPVAIFDPVELEGTTVSRASVHNVSILKELQLGIGDKIQVIKSNMIIPQVVENLTRSGNLEIPKTCPTCSGETKVINSNGTEFLFCTNPDCKEKLIGRIEHFCKRNAMNIVGMSESTVEFLVKKGWVTNYKDLYELQKYKTQWSSIPGFGDRSVTKILSAIDNSRNTDPDRLLYAIGIPKVGESQSKEIFKNFSTWNDFIAALDEGYDFSRLEGFGDILNDIIHKWYKEQYKEKRIPELVKELNFTENVNSSESQVLKGKIFVITGSLVKHKSRNELKDKIEKLGGKVSSSISSKTSYLINNDISSNSSKNKKAKELNIPIINEDSFLQLL